jgi:hypothetical protein
VFIAVRLLCVLHPKSAVLITPIRTVVVEITKNTAMDLVRCYEQHLASGDDYYWTLVSTGFWYNRRFPPDRLLPALEVVVWPSTASQVSPEKREAAVSLLFNKSDIQVVLSLT